MSERSDSRHCSGQHIHIVELDPGAEIHQIERPLNVDIVDLPVFPGVVGVIDTDRAI
jgi:hypothetical protein